MKFRGKLVDLVMLANGWQRLTIETKNDLRGEYDNLHGDEISGEIKKYRKNRSLTANAYFHVLVNKIASALRTSDIEVKRRLAVDYGTAATDVDGSPYVVQLPATADIDKFYPYTKMYRSVERNGMTWNCYLLFKRTHTMDSAEMARLIEGTVYEAKQLGIETMTPAELQALNEAWKGEGDGRFDE